MQRTAPLPRYRRTDWLSAEGRAPHGPVSRPEGRGAASPMRIGHSARVPVIRPRSETVDDPARGLPDARAPPGRRWSLAGNTIRPVVEWNNPRSAPSSVDSPTPRRDRTVPGSTPVRLVEAESCLIAAPAARPAHRPPGSKPAPSSRSRRAGGDESWGGTAPAMRGGRRRPMCHGRSAPCANRSMATRLMPRRSSLPEPSTGRAGTFTN